MRADFRNEAEALDIDKNCLESYVGSVEDDYDYRDLTDVSIWTCAVNITLFDQFLRSVADVLDSSRDVRDMLTDAIKEGKIEDTKKAKRLSDEFTKDALKLDVLFEKMCSYEESNSNVREIPYYAGDLIAALQLRHDPRCRYKDRSYTSSNPKYNQNVDDLLASLI